MKLQLLSNPSMSGVAVQVNWSDIEASEDKPDWSQLDALFAAAAKKWVHLIMFPGFFSSPWALEGVQTDLFEIQYVPGKVVRLHEAVERPLRRVARVQNDRGCRPHLCFRGDDFAELAGRAQAMDGRRLCARPGT
jgi:hypothetical protein